MAVATPPTGVSNGELVRWTFEVLDTHDVEPLRHVWTDATFERFPSTTIATKAAFNAKTRLLARLRDRNRR